MPFIFVEFDWVRTESDSKIPILQLEENLKIDEILRVHCKWPEHPESTVNCKTLWQNNTYERSMQFLYSLFEIIKFLFLSFFHYLSLGYLADARAFLEKVCKYSASTFEESCQFSNNFATSHVCRQFRFQTRAVTFRTPFAVTISVLIKDYTSDVSAFKPDVMYDIWFGPFENLLADFHIVHVVWI